MISNIRETKGVCAIAALISLAVIAAASSPAHARLYMMRQGSQVYPDATPAGPPTPAMPTPLAGGAPIRPTAAAPLPPVSPTMALRTPGRMPSPTGAGFNKPHVGANVYPDIAAPHPDGPNLYQYVRSNPVNRVDPQGLWSDKVHYTGTFAMARKVGFNKKCAKILAEWDQGVDDWTGSSLFTWYHFNKDVNGNPYACGRDCWFQKRWKQGVNKLNKANVYWSLSAWDVSVTDGLAHIGEALHSRQDSFAHNAKHHAETPFDHAPDVICMLWGDGFGILYKQCINARLTNPNWGKTVNKGTQYVAGRGRPDDEVKWQADYHATLKDTEALLQQVWRIPAVQCHCK